MASLRLFFVFSLVLFWTSGAIAGEKKDQHRYYSGYAGSLSSDPRNLARTYFENSNIQKLIREIAASGPAPLKRVEQALAGTPFIVSDLLRVKLLRQEGSKFHIGFNFFTAEDMRQVVLAAEKYVPSLVHAYTSKQDELARIFSRYPIKTVDRSKLAFVLVAGFSLNWDALRIAKESGFRKPVMTGGNGWKYSFWASEELPDHDTHGFYWGSSTFPLGRFNFNVDPADYSFSSYGDPYSDPRMNFPDLFTLPLQEMTPPVRKAVESAGLIHETLLGLDLSDVLGLESAKDLAAILFALRKSPQDEATLATNVRTSRKLPTLLSLLEEVQYIQADGQGKYNLLIPVLDHNDKLMVDDSLKLSRQILQQWLASSYPKLRKDLGDLSAMRQGVPFESLFTQIWHELFGLGTRELVRSGFLYDPYGESQRYKGSFPALWRNSVYKLNLE